MVARRLILFAVSLLLLTGAAFAQVGNIHGAVLLPHQGGPAVGAAVTVYTMTHDSLTTTTDDSGHFAFEGVSVGGYMVRAVLEGYLPAMNRVFVRADQTARVVLVLRGVPQITYGNIQGRAVLANHEGPAVGATVTLYFMHHDSLTTTADDSGRFAFDSLRTGMYMVRATLEGYLPAVQRVAVRPNHTAHALLVLRPVPTASVSGTVVLSDSITPVADAFVILGPHRPHGGLHTRTDSTGAFAFEHVAAGHYVIIAFKREIGFARQQIDVVDGQTLNLTLVLTADSTHREFDFDSPDNPIVSKETAGPATRFEATNYPNPFNPTTTINYTVPMSGSVRLAVFDVLGRKVADLVNSYQEAGTYHVSFSGANLPSGFYFYRVTAGNLTHTGRMMLLK